MREIKFRAKVKLPSYPYYRKNLIPEGTWVFGELHLNSPTPHIHTSLFEKQPIDPKTAGQFVCLDCKGKEIYDGDIVRTRVSNGRFTRNPRYENLVVSYDERRGRWENGRLGTFYPSRMEVIGNIYDNPELLKGISI